MECQFLLKLYLLQASKCEIQYFPFDGPEDHIPAKDTIDQLISNSGLQNAFSFVKIYAAWETDRIIGFELWRNVGLAFLCVFLVTIVFLGNLRICFMVMSIVGMTLVEVIGFLHFWNITIDIISCISVVISIGLCVDYSVHIGHAYKVAEGSICKVCVTFSHLFFRFPNRKSNPKY